MAVKNRRKKTLEERYGKYTESTIRLSADGIDYDVLLVNYIMGMKKLFSGSEYENLTTYDAQMETFLINMGKKFNNPDEENDRFNEECNSYRTYTRTFDNVIEAKFNSSTVKGKYERKCIHLLKDMEVFLGVKLLGDPEESLRKKNEYIHSLILPLIDIMIKTDLFYYLPHSTKALGYQCYWNQLRMIENNIEILFKGEAQEKYEVWQEILEPLRKIIGDGEDEDCYPGGDFSGITSELWLNANPALAYFDCVYDVAERDYQLYKSIIDGHYGNVHFNFMIGEDESEVKESIEKKNKYFIKEGLKAAQGNFEKEKQVFFIEFRKAYVKIVKDRMNIESE